MFAIDTVVLDMDGVLARSHRERRLAMLAEWSGREVAEIDRAIFKSRFEEEAEQGLWSPASYLLETGRRLGYELTVDQWVLARKAATEPDPDVLGLARSLSTRWRVGMFTNNPLMLKEHFEQVFPEAAAIVGESAVFSAELGRRKPDPEAFRLLARRLQTPPSAMLFIDDDPRYVDGARRAGLHAEVFTGCAQLIEQLAVYGVVP